jgi:mono/diheme cytochrome c family protein
MKKLLIIVGCVTLVAVLVSCSDKRRSTGRAYMPDMSYSRAYETYAALDTAKFTSVRDNWDKDGHKIYYTAKPVIGTMAQGDLRPYENHNDSTGYAASATVKSPLDPATIDMKEAERLYLVNCGICHGTKLDGGGPLYKRSDGSDGPYPAKPANLSGSDDKYKTMSEGTMFHSITYGKGAMGSYASQLSTKQRWQVIAYIKGKQNGSAPKDTMKTTGAQVKDTIPKGAVPATPGRD